MKKQELKDFLATRVKLREDLLTEPDPRVRLELALTLDLIEPIIDREINKLVEEMAA